MIWAKHSSRISTKGERTEGIRTLEGGLSDLGIGGLDGEDEGAEDEVSVWMRDAEEGGGVVGGAWEGLEAVESGLAGGDEVVVLAAGGVFYDLVEGGGEDAAGAGATAERLEGGHGGRIRT